MAQVTKNVQADIDRLLVFLTGEYEWAVESSSEWDENQLASFVGEQPLREEMLDDLVAYARLNQLSPEQRDEFDKLISFLDRHHSFLESILES